MTLRSRKSGRSRLNAIAIMPPNAPRTTIVSAVSFQFNQKRMPNARTAVIRLPTSWMSPVPTMLRTPSASLMTREMRTPVFVESKYETGRRTT